jgi:hypothetical protein
MAYSDWRAYQEATAEAFRRLGCNAQVDYRAKGVRSKHDIDVYATFIRSGILCSWVIECKLWKTRVTKEKVLALKSTIDDLGADRGIIVSEEGFQTGAQHAARGTNITLVTSLDEFAKTAMAASSGVPLSLKGDGNGEPIHEFPDRSGPSDLLVHGEFIITANWTGCSISIIDPSSKVIVRTIELDKYETISSRDGAREIRGHPPGSLAIADGRLFVGQVFSDVVLVIDLATHAIVKRITVPGGGEGRLAVSRDEKTVYFASNRLNQFYIIDSATYSIAEVPYPAGGRGCVSLLRHPTLPFLYIGIQRGGRIGGRGYPHANCYVAIYDLIQCMYVATPQLAEIVDGKTDDATPACLTYDEIYDRLYVGMFQSKRGICVLQAESGNPIQDVRFALSPWNSQFPWADPLSQALSSSLLLTVNRNNCELVALDRASLQVKKCLFVGDAPNGPSAVLVWKQHAVVSYPARNGLIFVPLDALN